MRPEHGQEQELMLSRQLFTLVVVHVNCVLQKGRELKNSSVFVEINNNNRYSMLVVNITLNIYTNFNPFMLRRSNVIWLG